MEKPREVSDVRLIEIVRRDNVVSGPFMVELLARLLERLSRRADSPDSEP